METASLEILALTLLRAVVEVAGMFLLAQGILFLLTGPTRDDNFVYRLFGAITRPAVRAARFILPRKISDGHVPFVAFFLLFWLWILLAHARRLICAANGLACA